MRNPMVLFNTLYTLTEDLRQAAFTVCPNSEARFCNEVYILCSDHWMRLYELNPRARESKLRNFNEEELESLEQLIRLAKSACAMVEANA